MIAVYTDDDESILTMLIWPYFCTDSGSTGQCPAASLYRASLRWISPPEMGPLDHTRSGHSARQLVTCLAVCVALWLSRRAIYANLSAGAADVAVGGRANTGMLGGKLVSCRADCNYIRIRTSVGEQATWHRPQRHCNSTSFQRAQRTENVWLLYES